MVSRTLLAVALAACAWTGALGVADADPNALWDIVSQQCVPDEQQHGDPAPCAAVDLGTGVDHGTAVLKDLVGPTQFLLIPTARVTGIESPELLAPDAPNYFAAAWRARTFVDERAGWMVPRDWISLAINSEAARTQDQLHIHVDCVRRDVRAALARHAATLGPAWAPFPEPLVGDRYSVRTVDGDDLDGVDPFRLLADGIPGARADMGAQTLVVVGAYAPDGRPRFVLLADHVSDGDTAGGEVLQDHESCPSPK
jgi:CDP-diacylglycerol pyrophosphatase